MTNEIAARTRDKNKNRIDIKWDSYSYKTRIKRNYAVKRCTCGNIHKHSRPDVTYTASIIARLIKSIKPYINKYLTLLAQEKFTLLQ